MKIIVLDTNIWLSELALMSPLGCAFSHYITVSNIKIGLPEVVEIEAKNNFKKNLINYREDIRKNYNRMLAIFGQMLEIVLPENEVIDQKVEKIFDFHGDRLIRVPFDFEGARSSFDKIINKLSPNSDSNQQFKDGVIWANCLKLAEQGDVSLVTEDKAFYKNRDYSQGLATNLVEEANKTPHSVKIFSELSLVIDQIKSNIDLNKQKLIEEIEENTYSKVLEFANKMDFELIGIAGSNFEFYATTNPAEISVKSNIKYNLENRSSEERTDGTIESKSEFVLNITNYNIRDFIKDGEYLSWKDENSELKQNSSTYGYLNSVLGHRTIEHRISYKIE